MKYDYDKNSVGIGIFIGMVATIAGLTLLRYLQ